MLKIFLKKKQIFKNFFKLEKKFRKFKFRKKTILLKRKKFSYYKNYKDKFTNYSNLLYFLKYFITLKKNSFKLNLIAKHKAKKKKKHFIKIMYSHKNKLHLLKQLNLIFNYNKRYDSRTKIHDIKRKYVSYLLHSRSLYKVFKIRTKHNFKFFKRHFRAIASLNINTRLNFYESSVKSLIIKLKYAYTITLSELFIKSGFIFLNGYQEFNPNKFLNLGDFFEIIYSKFIFKYKLKIKKKIKKTM